MISLSVATLDKLTIGFLKKRVRLDLLYKINEYIETL